MSSLLFLNTRDGEVDENYNNFWSIDLPRLNMLRDFRISLQNIEFANTVYPINRHNNKLYFSEDGNPTVTATLSVNSYTYTTMAVELKAQLEAAGAGTYTVTYNTSSKKFTIAVSGGATNFQWVTGVDNAYEELGFDESLFTNSISLTSNYPINLSGSRYVDVVTNFSGFNHSVSTTANVLVRVPIDVNFGSVVFYEPNTDDNLFVSADQLDDIYVQLRDEKGNFWELPKNSHLSITFKITENEDKKRQRLQ